MNARTITTLVASTFLLAILQLVAGLVNFWAALVCAILLAPLALAIFHFFEVEFSNRWVSLVPSFVASTAGIAIVYLAIQDDPALLLAPLATAATAGLIEAIRGRNSRRCGLCNHRITDVAFNCPRCGLLVCEQTCWSFDNCRCTLCEQNRVPIFTPDGRWWDKQFGPRSTYGRCQLCMTAAEQTDLRVCGKCGRPQCRECWDFSNGQCSRCRWTVEDLPESLRPFTVAQRTQGTTRR